MDSKKIFLRKSLTTLTLRYHIKRFFQITEFTSEYIAIQTKYGQNKIEAPTHTLGNYLVINLNNEGEITSYIDHLCSQFKEIKKEVKPIYIISFTSISTDKENYEKFLKDFISQINPL